MLKDEKNKTCCHAPLAPVSLWEVSQHVSLMLLCLKADVSLAETEPDLLLCLSFTTTWHSPLVVYVRWGVRPHPEDGLQVRSCLLICIFEFSSGETSWEVCRPSQEMSPNFSSKVHTYPFTFSFTHTQYNQRGEETEMQLSVYPWECVCVQYCMFVT